MNFDLQILATSSKTGEAAKNGDVKLLEALIASGESVRTFDNCGFRPIHDAANGSSEGHTECLKLLIEHDDTDVDWVTHDLRTPLGIAAGTKDPYRKLKMLLEAGANPMIQSGHRGFPIFEAIENKQQDIVNLMLSYYEGEDIDKKSDLGYTHLAVAMVTGCPHLTKILLEHNASVAVCDFYKTSNLLLSFLLHDAHTQHTIIDMLFHQLEKKGTKFAENTVNIQDVNGNSALHEAASAGCLHCVTRLLKFGADPMILDKNHHLPFHKAIESNDSKYYSCSVLKMLEKYTNMYIICNPKKFSDTYASTLVYAIEKNSYPVFKYLLALPINPDDSIELVSLNNRWRKKFYKYKTPLSVALSLARVNMVEELLGAGANVYSKRDYQDLLCAAVKGGSKYLCELILSRNPRINTVHDGIPICLMQALKNPVAFRYVLYQGADPHLCTGTWFFDRVQQLRAELQIKFTSTLFEYLGHHRMIYDLYKEIKWNVNRYPDTAPIKTKCKNFKNSIDKPVSLQKLCRNVVRKQLFTARISRMQSISIPDLRSELKDFLPCKLGDIIFENTFADICNFNNERPTI